MPLAGNCSPTACSMLLHSHPNNLTTLTHHNVNVEGCDWSTQIISAGTFTFPGNSGEGVRQKESRQIGPVNVHFRGSSVGQECGKFTHSHPRVVQQWDRPPLHMSWPARQHLLCINLQYMRLQEQLNLQLPLFTV